ncbi:MAG: FMN-binding protein [Clostridia bacterium]|jgi:major membrane immunogen (membrane-anchored lipoprotein)|nr:FMN-binding protein [Clostridia bacterium]
MKKWVLLLVCIIAVGAAVVFYYPRLHEPEPAVEETMVSPLKPGTYRVEFSEPDERGWKAFFAMEVNSAGEIAQANFDYISAAGILKTQDQAYNTRMKAANGLGPSEYCPRFAKNLLIYQNPEQVDGITGATSSYHDFKEFAQKAFAAAHTGSQEVIYLSQPKAEEHEQEEAEES